MMNLSPRSKRFWGKYHKNDFQCFIVYNTWFWYIYLKIWRDYREGVHAKKHIINHFEMKLACYIRINIYTGIYREREILVFSCEFLLTEWLRHARAHTQQVFSNAHCQSLCHSICYCLLFVRTCSEASEKWIAELISKQIDVRIWIGYTCMRFMTYLWSDIMCGMC